MEDKLLRSMQWKVEGLFWLITLVIAALILYPVYVCFDEDFPFYVYNAINIILFLTFFRYIFLLRFAPFSHHMMTKIIILCIAFPLFFFVTDSISYFQRFVDEQNLLSITTMENVTQAKKYISYTTGQYIFFATAAWVTIVMIPIRMIVSMWRVKNRDTV